MRPRRKILLIDPDDNRQSITRLVLENTGRFRVIGIASVDDACAVEQMPDLVLAYAPVNERDVADLARTITGFPIPSIYVATREHEAQRIADSTLVNPIPMELIERVRLITSRKRGPRQGTPRPPRKDAVPTVALVA